MSLIGLVKDQLLKAVKNRDEPAKNVLRVLLSKVQQVGKDNDDAVIAAARLLIKQNGEEISTRQGNLTLPDQTVKKVEVTGQEGEIQRLQSEIETLKQFLPNYLSEETIKAILLTKIDMVKAAKNAGAATGVAMGILKNHGPVEGETVKRVAGEIYGG